MIRLWGMTSIVAFALMGNLAAEGLSGILQDGGGQPVPGAFMMLVTPKFAMKQYANTAAGGTFSLSGAAKDDLVIVQAPSKPNAEGLTIYSLQPRIFRVGAESKANLQLPAAGCVVLKGYDSNGKLMRCEDYTKRGSFAGQYCYLTDLDNQMCGPSCWWVHDKESNVPGAQREKGLPAFAVEPGGKCAVQMLFWDAPGYGKLWLRADNDGKGFGVNAAGECVIVEVSVELAKTAVRDLARRAEHFPADAQAQIKDVEGRLAEALKASDEPKRAAGASGVLSAALKLRDDLEYEAAKTAIPSVRKGKAHIQVQGGKAGKCAVQLKQQKHDFLFGVLEGSPYNATAYQQARKAGFELATVLLGWNWTEPKGDDWSAVDKTFGVSALKKLGYTVKAHGVIFLQAYGITPDKALKMDKKDLPNAILEHQKVLLNGALGKQIDLWEIINEPGYTNILGLDRKDVIATMAAAAKNIKEITSKPSLVNSAHDITFGAKYMVYATNGKPADDYPLTFSEFLKLAADAGAMKDADLIGLQVYPGTHLSAMFGGLEGPAFTPSWLLDTIERYAQFGKPIHITEFSLPSSYGKTWNCGYWRAPWDEKTQADYADAVYTLAFGNPHVQSVTWWGVSALKPDVETGNLFDRTGKPKPVAERLQQLIKEWTTDASDKTDATGNVTLEGFGGDYELTVTPEGGKPVTQQVHIRERETTEVTVQLGS